MLTPDQLLQQGRYQIINQLGQNGIGAGYEAFDKAQNANVLLKEIHDNSNKIATPAQLESKKLAFENQAKILTKLKHESLLQVHHYFSEIDRHYLVAENIEGSNMNELLEKNKTSFEVSNASAWIEQLLDAVNYLHQQIPPIIHRDIKPSNLKLTSDGKIKLQTFGITQSADARANAAMSQSFDAAALPYSPLEQIWEGLDAASKKVILNSYDDESQKILEQPMDARSDIYSVGATAYQLLTGRLPIDALTRSIDILEGKIDPLPTPFELNSSIPQEVSDVVMTALEIRREHRFSSAAIMRQVLRTAFVRVKERETNSVKKEENVLEIPVVEPKPAPKPPVKQENVPIEDDQKRQLEFIKQQLREAEARRLEAERRAADAEKRLLEKEAKILKVKDMHILQTKDGSAPADNSANMEIPSEMKVPVQNAAENTIQPAPVKEISQPKEEKYEPVSQSTAPQDEQDDFAGMFSQPEKDNGFVKKMAAAAGVLVIFAGAAWAVWTFVVSKPGSSQPSITPTAAVSTPAPTIETTPDAATENSNPAASETTENTTTSPESTETSTSTAAKTKPAAAATPPPAKKQNVATTKAPEKKPVTLDDLLKDN